MLLMQRLARTLQALCRSRAGNILPLSAMAIFALAALVGGAMDISRGWRVQTRLQSACDSAVLAGRRAVSAKGYDDAAEAEANRYFYANFDEDHQDSKDTDFTSSSADKGSTIIGRATTKLPPVMMQIFGFEGFDLVADCTATMGVGNSDVMMVLDTTGSMAWELTGSKQTRIQALRAAMKNFYSTLESSASGTTARIRYGFVPYSSSVNVGRLLVDRDPDYLVDSHTYQSRLAIFKTVNTLTGYGTPVNASDTSTSATTYSSWSNHSGSYLLSSTCNSAKPANTAFTNTGAATTTTSTTINGQGKQVTTTTTTQPQTATEYACNWTLLGYYVQKRTATRNQITTQTATADPVYTPTQVFDRWEYRPVTYDTSRFKLFESTSTRTGDNGTLVASTWRGCIEERATVSEPTFTWNALNGITPEGAQDLDIDTPPDGSPESKWAPMWGSVAYIRTFVSGGVTYMNSALPSATGQAAATFCPAPAQLLSTMNKAAFDAYADALVPEGATYHDIGMVWGARLFSPDGIWADNVTEPADNGSQVGKHLVFMTDGEMSPSYSTQSAWGIEYHDRRVTDDGVSNDASRHNSRFLALCEAVKAKGIRIWVVAFASGLTSELSTCASTNSAFTASNASQLDEAFQSIAKQVGELRVVQ